MLIPYSWCFHVRDVQIALLKLVTLIGATLWTKILANKIVITTFSLVPVKYGINHTAAMGIFVWAVKQVWY